MIFILRKLRKVLLTKNKFTTYLLYAIGEIVLVVIGILIALQINNGNELRKARKKEIAYLKNVKVDLQNEITNSEYFKNYHFTKAEVSSGLIHGEPPTTIQEARNYTDRYETVFIWENFVPNNNTFKELLSSGNLSLIQNDTIKNGLLELENRYATIAGGEAHMRREFEEYLYDPHLKMIEALDFFDTKTPKYGFLDRLEADDIPVSDRERIIKNGQIQHVNPVFRNGLKLAMMNNSSLAGQHNELIDFLNELIGYIDRELKR